MDNIEKKIKALELRVNIYQRTRNNKVLNLLLMIFACFWVVVLISYCLYLQGNRYFLLVIHAKSNPMMLWLTCWIVTNVEYCILFGAIIGKFNKSLLKAILIFIPIGLISIWLFPESAIQTLVIPFCYALLYAFLYYKNLKDSSLSLARGIVSVGLLAAYQHFMIPVKTNITGFHGLNVIKPTNIIALIFINLDIISITLLASIISIMIGGVICGRNRRFRFFGFRV